MPLYEYKCRRCHHRFEVIQNLSDKPVRKCPMCRKGTVQKLLSSPALRFKGSGWYVTDYGRKGTAGTESGAEGSGGDSAGKEGEAGKEKAEGKTGKAPAKSEPARKTGKKD